MDDKNNVSVAAAIGRRLRLETKFFKLNMLKTLWLQNLSAYIYTFADTVVLHFQCLGGGGNWSKVEIGNQFFQNRSSRHSLILSPELSSGRK